MRKVKLYDTVLKVLTEKPATRSDDKVLIWEVLREFGYITFFGGNSLSYERFMKSPSFESIRRCRQKIQEKRADLQATDKVRKLRSSISEEKGTHVYRETVLPLRNADSLTDQQSFF